MPAYNNSIGRYTSQREKLQSNTSALRLISFNAIYLYIYARTHTHKHTSLHNTHTANIPVNTDRHIPHLQFFHIQSVLFL